MKLIALDVFDTHLEGDEFECGEAQARALIAKGLAKLGTVPLNKKAIPAENKANPLQAAGTEPPLSASRAARVSRQTTAKPSARGAAKKKTGK